MVVKALRSRPVSTQRGFVIRTCKPFLTRLSTHSSRFSVAICGARISVRYPFSCISFNSFCCESVRVQLV